MSLVSDFDRSIVRQTAHRPWPMPRRPWVMTQSWHQLLLAHWRVDPATLRRMVPQPFEIDLFDGEAWIAVVPFLMTNVALRGTPSLPWLSAFPELNVRTYVRVDDRPGVYFFSLDAGRRVAVGTARTVLNLPYFSATMRVRADGDRIAYHSERRGYPPAAFRGWYEPTDPSANPAPGSLEHFLTERYCLYHVDRRGTPYRLEIHHRPWPLQRAQAEIETNTMASAIGISLTGPPPLLHFARRLDVVTWAPTSLA